MLRGVGCARRVGTVIASWVDGAGEGSGAYRVEASVRTPGAAVFATGQRLPVMSDGTDHLLVSSGNNAVLIWTTLRPVPGRRYARQAIMLSGYSAAGPAASQAPLPKHPGTSCDD